MIATLTAAGPSLVDWGAVSSAWSPTLVTSAGTAGSPEASGIAGLAVLAAIVYGVSVAVSLAIGVVVVTISEHTRQTSYLGSVESRLLTRPLRAAGIGVATYGGAVLTTILLAIALLVAIEVGAPEPIALLLAIPILGGNLLVYGIATVGTVLLGSWLLRRVGRDGRNRWVGLLGGALVINVPGINLLLVVPLLVCTTGAMVDDWWHGRRAGPQDSDDDIPAEM